MRSQYDLMHQIANLIIIALMIIVILLVPGIATSHVIFLVSSQLVLANFVFKNTCKTIFEAIVVCVWYASLWCCWPMCCWWCSSKGRSKGRRLKTYLCMLLFLIRSPILCSMGLFILIVDEISAWSISFNFKVCVWSKSSESIGDDNFTFGVSLNDSDG